MRRSFKHQNNFVKILTWRNNTDRENLNMSKGFIDSTGASDPLRLKLSFVKLRRLHPELFGWRGCFFKMRFGLRQLNANEAKTLLTGQPFSSNH